MISDSLEYFAIWSCRKLPGLQYAKCRIKSLYYYASTESSSESLRYLYRSYWTSTSKLTPVGSASAAVQVFLNDSRAHLYGRTGQVWACVLSLFVYLPRVLYVVLSPDKASKKAKLASSSNQGRFCSEVFNLSLSDSHGPSISILYNKSPQLLLLLVIHATVPTFRSISTSRTRMPPCSNMTPFGAFLAGRMTRVRLNSCPQHWCTSFRHLELRHHQAGISERS